MTDTATTRGLAANEIHKLLTWQRTVLGECSPSTRPTFFVERNMDKDRIKGAGHQAKGAVKEAIGKVTGDTKTQAEGAAEKNAGKVQNAIGGAKDAAREVLKK